MPSFNNQTVADAYTDATTIKDVYNSNGGSVDVETNNVFYSLQYGKPGLYEWTEDLFARPGSITLLPGTTGFKIKNAVAGMAAIASARIAPPAQPAASIASTASATSGATGVLTGIIPAAGQTATAGSGFTYTHTNGTGVYVFAITTALANTPVVLVTVNSAGGSMATIATVSTTAFTVRTFDSTGAAADRAFNFSAQIVQ